MQAEQQQAEAVIKNLFYIVIFFTSGLLFFGCSTSQYASLGEERDEEYGEVAEEETPQADEQIETRTSPSQQRFNVQADTLSVNARKKTNGNKTGISVRAATPSKYYSVQIGAYRKKMNADRNYTLSQKRFKLPMIRLYEGGIKMERICTGKFPTKKKAEEFLKKIQEQYPKDYIEAWVVMFKK